MPQQSHSTSKQMVNYNGASRPLIRGIFSLALVLYALVGFGQDSSIPLPIQVPIPLPIQVPIPLPIQVPIPLPIQVPIPPSIRVPESSRLIWHAYAKGVQVYVCTQDPKDTANFIWTFKEPRANLYADSSYHQLVGRHYFDAGKNPTWETADGSKVSGIKVQQANSPDSAAIPWLLLHVTTTSGNATLTQAIFIQRIRTKGGKAPAKGDRPNKGQSIEVAYTAEYLFYKI